MRKIALAILVAFGVSGCAAIQTLQSVYEVATTTEVTPQQALIAANAFNAIQGTATQYLVYCKPRLAEPVCSAVNRRVVIRGVRAGRAARNQIEASLTTGKPVPAQVYNSLMAIVKSLTTSAASKVGAQ